MATLTSGPNQNADQVNQLWQLYLKARESGNKQEADNIYAQLQDIATNGSDPGGRSMANVITQSNAQSIPTNQPAPPPQAPTGPPIGGAAANTANPPGPGQNPGTSATRATSPSAIGQSGGVVPGGAMPSKPSPGPFTQALSQTAPLAQTSPGSSQSGPSSSVQGNQVGYGQRRGDIGGNQVGFQYSATNPVPTGPTAPAPNQSPSPSTVSPSPMNDGTSTGVYHQNESMYPGPVPGMPMEGQAGAPDRPYDQSQSSMNGDPNSWWAQQGINPGNYYSTFNPWDTQGGGLDAVLNAYEQANGLPGYWSDQYAPLIQQQMQLSYLSGNPLNSPGEVLNAIPTMVQQMSTPGNYFAPGEAWTSFMQQGVNAPTAGGDGTQNVFASMDPRQQVQYVVGEWDMITNGNLDPMFQQNGILMLKQLGDEYVTKHAKGEFTGSFIDYANANGAGAWLA